METRNQYQPTTDSQETIHENPNALSPTPMNLQFFAGDGTVIDWTKLVDTTAGNTPIFTTLPDDDLGVDDEPEDESIGGVLGAEDEGDPNAPDDPEHDEDYEDAPESPALYLARLRVTDRNIPHLQADMMVVIDEEGKLLAVKVDEQGERTETPILIEEGNIADGSIDGIKLAAGTVGGTQLAVDSITTTHLQAGSVDADIINAGAINAEHISAKAVQAEHIDAGTIKADHIDAGAITAEKIDAKAIKTEHLEAGSVTADIIAAESITAGKIAAGAITAGTIDADAINTAEIKAAVADISRAEIETADIDFAKVKDLVADKALISQGVGGNFFFRDLEVVDANIVELNANKIKAGTLSVERLELVGSDKSLVYELNKLNGATALTETEVLKSKLDAGATLADQTITPDKIVTKSITTDQLAVNCIKADNIDALAVTTGHIKSEAIVANHIKTGAITTTQLESDIGAKLNISSNVAITSKVSNETYKKDKDALDEWIGTTELAIKPDAITSTVKKSGAFEGTITKQSTAPTKPTDGQLWCDTSVTPNIVKRWSGSAWVATAFTQGDVQSIIQQSASQVRMAFGEIGGEQLLKNSGFASDSTGWNLGTNVTRNTSITFRGQNTIQSNQSGVASNSWRGIFYQGRIPVTQGDVFTMSVWVMTNNVASVDLGIGIEAYYFNAAGATIPGWASQMFTPTNTAWQRVSKTFTIPSGVSAIDFRAWVTRNGNVWFCMPQLERGTAVTDWTSHPNEIRAGVTTIDENGVTVTHTTLGNVKTQLGADGLRMYDGGSLIGGLYKPVASEAARLVAGTLMSPSVTDLIVDVGVTAADGTSIKGLRWRNPTNNVIMGGIYGYAASPTDARLYLKTANPLNIWSDSTSAGAIDIASGGGVTIRTFNNQDVDIAGSNNVTIVALGNNGIVCLCGSRVRMEGNTQPFYDNTFNLGAATLKWNNIYARTATINTSDEREKSGVRPLEGMLEFIMALRPIAYKWIDSDSGRVHYGLIAQQVKKAMDAAGIKDFAGYIRSPKDEETPYSDDLPEDEVVYGLRYEEFVAPLIACVQAQQKQLDMQDDIIAKQQTQLDAMSESITQLYTELSELRAHIST